MTSGEWASGKKWADDAPRELIDADSISLMSSGACGAFVHGLEDEFLGEYQPERKIYQTIFELIIASCCLYL